MKVLYLAFRDGVRCHNSTISMCDSKSHNIVVNKAERWVGVEPKLGVENYGLTIVPFENVKYIQTSAEPELASNSGASKAKKDN